MPTAIDVEVTETMPRVMLSDGSELSAPHPTRPISTIWRLYLPISLVLVLALSILTPPFQVPDEQQHFFRAYQISMLGWRGMVDDGKAGAVLPSSLVELSERFLGNREIHQVRTVHPAPWSETVQALQIPLEPQRQEFTNFLGAAFYSPVPYLAQASAIAIGRGAGLGPLGLLYVARVANGVTASLIVCLALAVIPAGALALFVFALLPMTLYEFASVSADAAVISTAFLYTAVALRARVRRAWRPHEVIIACLAAIDFLTVKPVYLPLLVVALPFELWQGSVLKTVRTYAIILTLAVGAAVAWLAYSRASIVVAMPGSDPGRQIATILASPLSYSIVLFHSLAVFAPQWAREAIGMLGWLNVRLPLPMYVVPPVALTLCAILPRRAEWQPGRLEIAWYVVLISATTVLVLTALYLYWAGIGGDVVPGVQGRYFLPLAGILAMIIQERVPLIRAAFAGWVTWVIIALAVAEAASTCFVVNSAYSVL